MLEYEGDIGRVESARARGCVGLVNQNSLTMTRYRLT